MPYFNIVATTNDSTVVTAYEPAERRAEAALGSCWVCPGLEGHRFHSRRPRRRTPAPWTLFAAPGSSAPSSG